MREARYISSECGLPNHLPNERRGSAPVHHAQERVIVNAPKGILNRKVIVPIVAVTTPGYDNRRSRAAGFVVRSTGRNASNSQRATRERGARGWT